jgi:GNAT superfamily N-acetyltransferase
MSLLIATYNIYPARTSSDYEAATALFEAYASWLDIDLSFQNFDSEVANLASIYAPPDGGLLLAQLQPPSSTTANLSGNRYRPHAGSGDIVGCVALRPLMPSYNSKAGSAEAKACELKRLYTLPSVRGMGIGRALLLTIVDAARDRGYTRMYLDTLMPRMAGAMKLYQSMGFVEVEAYYENGLAGAVFMCLDLRMT